MKALEGLPADLDETYNRIILSIRKDDITYAIQILRWLVFSPRPLLLTEVAEIAALDADRSPAFDRDEVLEDPLDVLSICSSLVSVVDTNNATNDGSEYGLGERVIILAHYSVKEYLISERIFDSQAASFYLKPLLCHQTIAKCCLHYLLQFEGSYALTAESMTTFALAKYSAQQWLTHVISGGERDMEIVALIISLLDSTSQAYLTLIRISDPDYSSGETKFSTYLVRSSSTTLLRMSCRLARGCTVLGRQRR